MRLRTTKFRWAARAAAGASLASILVVPLAAAAPAGARSEAWHKNTFDVTQAGVFHAYFLMPKWFELDPFLIVGPKRVSQCTLRFGATTQRARKINATYVYFDWPEKGLQSATRTTATCRHLAGGRVTAATVFLTWGGAHETRIALRHR